MKKFEPGQIVRVNNGSSFDDGCLFMILGPLEPAKITTRYVGYCVAAPLPHHRGQVYSFSSESLTLCEQRQ